ncbi:hypothetical protein AB0K48_07485 [Nonomuraea sp. NPDC055795]
MSEPTEPGQLGNPMSLHEHALRLHRLDPDAVLPRDGYPYCDDEHHQRSSSRRPSDDHRHRGADAAATLDAHFAKADAHPSELAWAFHDADVPIHRNDHIAAAALRAERGKVQQTGRWLVRHSPDRCSALIGLALLATDWAEEDIELIQIIGLLSDKFGPLAAEALKRRRGGAEALRWLAGRVKGWGRVYVVEALCLVGSTSERSWLLRHACDGDHLNGYFAGQVATATHLHQAITAPDVDDEMIDHTGRLLKIMAECGGMGMTWQHYPPISVVLDAHVGHLARQVPTVSRYLDAACIADHLSRMPPDTLELDPDRQDHLLARYLTVVNRSDWSKMAQAAFDPGDDFFIWFAQTIATRLRLSAFTQTDTE